MADSAYHSRRQINDAIKIASNEELIRLFSEDPSLILLELDNAALGDSGQPVRPIHLLSEERIRVPVVRLLLELGVPADLPGLDSETPMHIAAFAGNVELLGLLLEHGAQLDILSRDGLTPLDMTYPARSEATFEFLLSRGAVPSLFIALARNRMTMAEELLRTMSDNHLRQRMPGFFTVIFTEKCGPLDNIERKRAILRDLWLDVDSFFWSRELSGLLLSLNSGDMPKAIWWLGRTPELAETRVVLTDETLTSPLIHEVVRFPARLPVLQWLLANGISPDARNHKGRTPLHTALSRSNIEAVRALLTAGADRDAEDVDGLKLRNLLDHE